jgi:hypothetical protein
MVKVKTRRENYFKQLISEYYTGGIYQPYLGVEYLAEAQINENTRRKLDKPDERSQEIQIIYESIKRIYPRIIYNRRIAKPLKFVYRKPRPEVIVLD